jgi:hypothetical protein
VRHTVKIEGEWRGKYGANVSGQLEEVIIRFRERIEHKEAGQFKFSVPNCIFANFLIFLSSKALIIYALVRLDRSEGKTVRNTTTRSA